MNKNTYTAAIILSGVLTGCAYNKVHRVHYPTYPSPTPPDERIVANPPYDSPYQTKVPKPNPSTTPSGDETAVGVVLGNKTAVALGEEDNKSRDVSLPPPTQIPVVPDWIADPRAGIPYKKSNPSTTPSGDKTAVGVVLGNQTAVALGEESNKSKDVSLPPPAQTPVVSGWIADPRAGTLKGMKKINDTQKADKN